MTVLQKAIDDTHHYLDRIEVPRMKTADSEHLIALMHALDHLQRLHERCEEDEDRAFAARQSDQLAEPLQKLSKTVDALIADHTRGPWISSVGMAERVSMEISEQAETIRAQFLALIGQGEIDVPAATANLEAIRWLKRATHHVSRISYQMNQCFLSTGA